MRTLPERWRRTAGEVALFGLVAAFLAVIGPYETGALPAGIRLLYWLVCIIGGGGIGITIERIVGKWLQSGWRRQLAAAIGMTPPVTLLVLATGIAVSNQAVNVTSVLNLLWQVFVIALPILVIRGLMWRHPVTIVETRTIIEPPMPETEAAFRRRLSAKRRTARLIAVEAEDHFVRVHTDEGSELVTLRFADALTELESAYGTHVHRSWWVANDAIEAVKWRRGAGEARLVGDLSVPVSRKNAPALKAAGWR